ncbi:MAG: PAS domain S-box protein [Candidatus Aminicenantaceae bacterium]
MKDKNKKKNQLIEELKESRLRILKYEKLEEKWRRIESSIRESENRFRQAVENSPNPILSVDKYGIIHNWNPACEQVFKYKSEEILGQSFHKLLDDKKERRRIGAKLVQIWNGYTIRNQDLTLLSKDNKRRYMVSRMYPLRDLEGKVEECVISNTDITEHKKIEEALQRRATRLWLIGRLGQRTTSILRSKELLSQSVKLIKNTFNYYNVLIFLVEGKYLELKASSLPSLASKVDNYKIRIGEKGITSKVVESGEFMIVSDVKKNPNYLTILKKTEVKSELAVPIKLKSQVIGVLDAQSSFLNAFSQSDIYTLQTLADQLAIAIENARLYEQASSEIAKRKSTEKALRESEEKYRILAETAIDGIYIVNNRYFEYVNPACEKILGYKAEEICNENFNFLDTIHLEDREMIEERDKARMEGKQLPTLYSFRVITKKGQMKHVEVNTVKLPGKGVRVLGMLRDISEREKAEQDLKESEERYKALFDRSLHCVFIHDFNGKFLDANEASLKLLGYKREEINSISMSKLLDDEQMKKAMEKTEEIKNQGSQKEIVEYRLKTKDNRYVWIESEASLLYQDGKPYAIQGIARDITERKKSEEELKKAYNDLQQAQRGLIQSEKLAALGSFASGIAHEIKNPLGIIMGGIEFVEKKIKRAVSKTDKDLEMAIKKIKESVFRADNIIHGFLKFARPSELKIEKICLNELIKETVSLLQYRVPLDIITMKQELSKDRIYISADKNRIQQVFINLLINSVEAMSDGGELTVRVYKDNKSRKKPLCVTEIIDKGAGITEDNLAKIFEPYFTTKGDKKGTGLGLPTVQMIVEKHNGHIEIDSEMGEGTTARIFLPVQH